MVIFHNWLLLCLYYTRITSTLIVVLVCLIFIVLTWVYFGFDVIHLFFLKYATGITGCPPHYSGLDMLGRLAQTGTAFQT